jgi:hypothetical protein
VWIRHKEADASVGGFGVSLSMIKVGWVARPSFLLGVEISTTAHFEGDFWWSSTWVQLGHYDAMATWFPLHDNGFYLKGGLGAGFGTVEYGNLLGTQEKQTDHGFDARLGLGYEWQLLDSMNLGVDAVTNLVVFDGGRAHDVAVQLSFAWY